MFGHAVCPTLGFALCLCPCFRSKVRQGREGGRAEASGDAGVPQERRWESRRWHAEMCGYVLVEATELFQKSCAMAEETPQKFSQLRGPWNCSFEQRPRLTDPQPELMLEQKQSKLQDCAKAALRSPILHGSVCGEAPRTPCPSEPPLQPSTQHRHLQTAVEANHAFAEAKGS